jgi:hypothetical protein
MKKEEWRSATSGDKNVLTRINLQLKDDGDESGLGETGSRSEAEEERIPVVLGRPANKLLQIWSKIKGTKQAERVQTR